METQNALAPTNGAAIKHAAEDNKPVEDGKKLYKLTVLGVYLRIMREALGMSQDVLAARINSNNTYISRAELGVYVFTNEFLAALAPELQVSLARLLSLRDSTLATHKQMAKSDQRLDEAISRVITQHKVIETSGITPTPPTHPRPRKKQEEPVQQSLPFLEKKLAAPPTSSEHHPFIEYLLEMSKISQCPDDHTARELWLTGISRVYQATRVSKE